MSIFDFPIDPIGDSSVTTPQSGTTPRETDVRMLEQRLERLSMVCEALWEIVKQKTNVTDEHLASMVARIDLQDGAADGKNKRGPVTCGGCSRPNAPRHQFCLYCGRTLPKSPFA